MASSKTNGRGSIFQLDKGPDGRKPKSRCRKWRLVVSVGKDPRTGKYRQRTKTFEGTYTQAQRELRSFVEKVEGGENVKRNGWTVKDYAKHYVDARVAAGEIQERTANSLRSTLNTLCHRIGGMRLQEITPEVMEAAYIDLRNGESPSGKNLSDRSIYNVNLSAYLMFQHAKERGLIGENPLDKVPQPKKGTKEKDAMHPAMYRSLLAKLDATDRMQCGVLLCAALGLRRSESMGLSWGDVDFEGGTVNVHASTKDDAELKDTKTEAGNRILPMPEWLAEGLMRRKAQVVADLHKYQRHLLTAIMCKDDEGPKGAVKIGKVWYDVDPTVAVCCDQDGIRMKPDKLTHWWMRKRKSFGAEGWTLHGLRHTFLSLAAAQGIHPSVMQRLAGHKNPNITMRIYTHVNMESKREAMDAMQAAYMVAV